MEEVYTYGAITLLPPIATVVVALITKRAWEPLLLGATLGYIISDGFQFFWPWLDGIYSVFDEDGVWLMFCVLFIGIFSVLLEKSHGCRGFGNFVAKYATSEKKTFIMAWILGIIMFIDDYANTLTVTSAFKSVGDHHKTPREMLAYVTNSTGAPVCIIIPLSSWYVFFGGLINNEESLVPLGLGDGWEIYIGSIPFLFYGWAAVIIVPLVILGVIPKIGPMKAAYKRVAETGQLYSKESERYNRISKEAETESREGNPWNFVIPMVVVIGGTLYTGDLLVGLIWACAAAGVLFVVNKSMKFLEFIECFFIGLAEMSQMFYIMMTAIFVKVSMDNIGLSIYVVETVSPYLNATTFPVIVFIVVGLLAFCTGNNWGIPAITIPMVMPLSVACGANTYIVVGALLSGAAFGCHACFFSDTTVLTAKCSGISNMEHALSQLPYASIAAIISIILFIITGFTFV